MKVAVEKLENNQVLLKVEVPVEEVSAAISKAYKKISQETTIPGFRKGKIPREVIDAKVGREAVYNEALKQMLPSYYPQAVETSGIEPIVPPEIKIVQMEAAKPLLFDATVAVKPDVKLGKYEQVEVVRSPVKITDEEINAQVEQLREKFAQLVVVEEKRPLRRGDFALIDFKGYQSDTPIEGGSGTDYLLELGSGTFVPGFEDQLVGASKGEVCDVRITFPPNYPAKEIAGQEVRFNVLIKEMKQKVLPEVSDDFAKEVSEFKALEELKMDIRSKLGAAKEGQTQAKVQADILNLVTEGAEVEIPPVMIEERLNQMLNRFNYDLQSQGTTIKQYLEANHSNLEVLRESFRPQASKNVKIELVLEAIARAEGIEVTDEELDEQVKRYAQNTTKDFAEFKKVLAERGELLVIRENILWQKTIIWLNEHAKITVEKDEEVKEDRKKREKKVRAKK